MCLHTKFSCDLPTVICVRRLRVHVMHIHAGCTGEHINTANAAQRIVTEPDYYFIIELDAIYTAYTIGSNT